MKISQGDSYAIEKAFCNLARPRAARGVQFARGNAACRSHHSSPPNR